ncbi:cation diffusion facilitator family transporter [Mycetocola sp. CAN_C7]|uniref:cation diffusion facilitator family transporter n=1 Tax=Mycetocola sp. CAN_C7 TaxID=2787724 RepID=UPI0018CB4FD3
MTVIIAFCANVLVAVAKTVAAFLTGSASMVAEAAHSWADAGNEIFLLIADRRSSREKDEEHPRGYGREAWVWSLFAAVGIFTAGAVVSVTHGIQELTNPEPVESPAIAYLVLGVSFILEGISFAQAVRQSRRSASKRDQSTVRFVLTSSNATLRAVFLEDFAALIGLVIAATSIFVHQVTGNAVFDAIGSILIGVLLGVVALILIDQNRRYLIGANSSPGLRDAAGRALLASPDIDRVTYLHLEFVGPERLYLVAAVDLVGDAAESSVAERLRRIERSIEEHEGIETAVLSLSVHDEASLEFAAP